MTECQDPGCTENATETYQDAHGNELEVCGDHYYELVTPSAVSRITRQPRDEGTEGLFDMFL